MVVYIHTAGGGSGSSGSTEQEVSISRLQVIYSEPHGNGHSGAIAHASIPRILAPEPL